ncbi:MAG TPA: hypothetical protein VKB34_17015, partial [Povalibacter sp.]|nr:hypothetical protein [Povalibacter sp.]
VGVWSSIVTLTIAIVIGVAVSQSQISIFYYTQILNTFFAAPFAAIFILGVLWRRMNTRGAIAALTFGFLVAGAFKVAAEVGGILPRWVDNILNQAGLVLLASMLAGVIASYTTEPPREDQTTPDLSFRWSNSNLRSGFGSSIMNSVITWWLVMLVLFGVIVTVFSPLFFS